MARKYRERKYYDEIEELMSIVARKGDLKHHRSGLMLGPASPQTGSPLRSRKLLFSTKSANSIKFPSVSSLSTPSAPLSLSREGPRDASGSASPSPPQTNTVKLRVRSPPTHSHPIPEFTELGEKFYAYLSEEFKEFQPSLESMETPKSGKGGLALQKLGLSACSTLAKQLRLTQQQVEPERTKRELWKLTSHVEDLLPQLGGKNRGEAIHCLNTLWKSVIHLFDLQLQHEKSSEAKMSAAIDSVISAQVEKVKQKWKGKLAKLAEENKSLERKLETNDNLLLTMQAEVSSLHHQLWEKNIVIDAMTHIGERSDTLASLQTLMQDIRAIARTKEQASVTLSPKRRLTLGQDQGTQTGDSEYAVAVNGISHTQASHLFNSPTSTQLSHTHALTFCQNALKLVTPARGFLQALFHATTLAKSTRAEIYGQMADILATMQQSRELRLYAQLLEYPTLASVIAAQVLNALPTPRARLSKVVRKLGKVFGAYPELLGDTFSLLSLDEQQAAGMPLTPRGSASGFYNDSSALDLERYVAKEIHHIRYGSQDQARQMIGYCRVLLAISDRYGSEDALFDQLPTTQLTFAEFIEILREETGLVVLASEADAIQSYLGFQESPVSRTAIVEGLGFAKNIGQAQEVEIDQANILEAALSAWSQFTDAKFDTLVEASRGTYSDYRTFCQAEYPTLSPDDRNAILLSLLGQPSPTPNTLPDCWHNAVFHYLLGSKPGHTRPKNSVSARSVKNH